MQIKMVKYHFVSINLNKQSESWKDSESCSVMFNSSQPHGLYSPWDSPGQNTGVGSLSLLQWIFPTQGLKPRSPALRADSLPAEPPCYIPMGGKWIKIFSCIAGRGVDRASHSGEQLAVRWNRHPMTQLLYSWENTPTATLAQVPTVTYETVHYSTNHRGRQSHQFYL